MRTRGRWAALFFLLVVVITLTVAIWQYHQMIVAIYDGASASVYRRMMRPFASGSDSIGQKPVRIALWHAEAAGEVLGAPPRAFDEWVRQWEHFFARERFSYRRITGAALDVGALAEFNVLVLPTAVAMSNSEIEAVKRFLQRGNGVVMMWATGTRMETGAWRSASLLQQVGGLEITGPVPESDRAGVSSIAMSGRSPLTLGLPPGLVISVARYDEPLAARIREPRVEAVGAWIRASRWSPQSRLSMEDQRDRAVIAYGDYLGGRFVWFGFPLGAAARPDQAQAMDLLTRQAVAWAARQPIAYKMFWPENISGVFTLSWSLNHPDEFDERLPALAGQYRLPLTSFVSPRLVEEAPELVRRLANFGPVGLWEVDGDEVRQPPSIETLIRWREQIERLVGSRNVGARLSVPVVPDQWLDALVRAGYAYLSGTDYRHLLPQVVRTNRPLPVFARERELWLMPEMPLPDLEASVQSSRPLEYGIEAAVDAIAMEGGLLNLSLMAAQVDSTTMKRLDVILTRAKRARIWATDIVSVLEFYRVWGHLRVSTDYPTPNRSAIQISNTGTRYSGDLAVYILLARQAETVNITPTTLGSPSAHAFTADGITWRFDIARIPPGKNYLYHLYRTESR